MIFFLLTFKYVFFILSLEYFSNSSSLRACIYSTNNFTQYPFSLNNDRLARYLMQKCINKIFYDYKHLNNNIRSLKNTQTFQNIVAKMLKHRKHKFLADFEIDWIIFGNSSKTDTTCNYEALLFQQILHNCIL